jgi:hypothetical protein
MTTQPGIQMEFVLDTSDTNLSPGPGETVTDFAARLSKRASVVGAPVCGLFNGLELVAEPDKPSTDTSEPFYEQRVYPQI